MDEYTGGAGGILELHGEFVKFIRDSALFTCKRVGNKIWKDDSIMAEIVYEYPDSVRLLLGDKYRDYKKLIRFSGGREKFLNELNNTWSFVSDDYSITLTPENKPSYVLKGASIFSRIDFPQSNQVANFHLKSILQGESLILFGFDINHAFTTLQLIERNQDTIRCELYHNGMAIRGKLIKHPSIGDDEMAAIRTRLTSKIWLATWSYQKRKPIEDEIQLITERSPYIDSRSIKNGNISMQFFPDGKFRYKKDKSVELGSWRLSPEGAYILLKNEGGVETSLYILKSGGEKMTVVVIDHIKYNQNFLYRERITFR
ncbi:MAG: hypothetical protein BroJett042_12580 [Bacteroidota bacterium]|nr:MAG: hypothetical protein BroJett042_12580 [Bacteroidota bacterium]